MFLGARIADPSFQVTVENVLHYSSHVSGGLESLECVYGQISPQFAGTLISS